MDTMLKSPDLDGKQVFPAINQDTSNPSLASEEGFVRLLRTLETGAKCWEVLYSAWSYSDRTRIRITDDVAEAATLSSYGQDTTWTSLRPTDYGGVTVRHSRQATRPSDHRTGVVSRTMGRSFVHRGRRGVVHTIDTSGRAGRASRGVLYHAPIVSLSSQMSFDKSIVDGP